jgi:predicted GTPase
MDDAKSLVKSVVTPHTAFDRGLSSLQRHIATSKKRLAWKAQHPEAAMNDSPDLILVTGDSDTGKSSFCNTPQAIFTNSTRRMGGSSSDNTRAGVSNECGYYR